MDDKLMRCKCGGRPRYRYSMPVHWVECRNKRCDMHTRYYADMKEDDDPESKQRAIEEWNKMVKN